MCMWAPIDEPFTVQGDNLGSLNNAQRLKGRGALLAISREIAWRRAALRWRPVFSHRPAELNTVCDALSRVHAPGAYRVPPALLALPRASAPNPELLWKAWLGGPPPARAPKSTRPE
eukprot:1250216-Heterocapsa_arctica.AAC.1